MAGKVRYADKQAEFLALCRDGAPRDHIAARLGWSVDQVKNLHTWLRSMGQCPYPLLRRASPAKPHCSVLTGREDEIRKLFAAGLGRIRIARQLGVTANTLAGFVDRHGLRPPERKGRGKTGKLVGDQRITLPALALRSLRDYGIGEADIRAGAEMAKMMEMETV
jgi:DNA-binding CsgD family transcriptional regulator